MLPQRLHAGFKRSVSGQRLLRDRPDIVPVLADREALRALPDGSLGRAYLDFVESEGISPQGIRDASATGESGERKRPAPFDYLHARMRDTHDLWHGVTGYKGDVLGELGLLGFILAQNFNPAIALILFASMFKGYSRDVVGVIADGYRRGRKAAWLPAQDWEALLAMPVEEVRRSLKLGPPPAYTPVRTAQLRADGVV